MAGPTPLCQHPLGFAPPADLLDEIASEMAADLTALIETELLATLLGWHLVYAEGNDDDAAAQWCEANTVGKHQHGSSAFIFERKEDAALFKLFMG